MNLYLYTRVSKQQIQWRSGNTTGNLIDELKSGCSVVFEFDQSGIAFVATEDSKLFIQDLAQSLEQQSDRNSRKLAAPFNKMGAEDIAFAFDADNCNDLDRVIAIDALNLNLNITQLQSYLSERIVQNRFLNERYTVYAFGFDTLKFYAGEVAKEKRVCRFCGDKIADKRQDIAHAMPEAIGNKLLFCNEECYDCNHSLNTIEDNFSNFMAIRRALFHIKRKDNASVPTIIGQDFVIKPDANGCADIYLMEENLPENWRNEREIFTRLNMQYKTCDQSIYRAFVKMVIDLIPSELVTQFDETIEFITKSDQFIPDHLPIMRYAQLPDGVFYEQPQIEIFIKRNIHLNMPYCFAILRIYDLVYCYVVPFTKPDKGRYRRDNELVEFWSNIQTKPLLHWFDLDLNNWWQSAPWVEWTFDLNSPNVHVLPRTDHIFDKCNIYNEYGSNVEFPDVNTDNIRVKRVIKATFKDYCKHEACFSQAELTDTTVEVSPPTITIDLQNQQLILDMSLSAETAASKRKYFSSEIVVVVSSPDFQKHINIDWNAKSAINQIFIRVVIDKAIGEGERRVRNLMQYSQFKNIHPYKDFNGKNDQFVRNLRYHIFAPYGECLIPFVFFHEEMRASKRYFWLKKQHSSSWEKFYPHRKTPK